MTRLPTLFALAAVAAALALPAAAAAPGTPGGTLKLEVAYLKAGQFQKMYQLYTAKFRALCPYGEWVVEAKKAQPQFKPATLKITQTVVAGKTALLSYQFLVNGKVAATTKGDLFVKIGNGWYDELDKVTTC